MSLDEVYSLAHIAQCRLDKEARRRNRSLRYVVGHMMHYESLRVQINEIEEDHSRNASSSYASHNEHVSTADSHNADDECHEDEEYFSEDDVYYDEEADSDDLCLSRCSSAMPSQSHSSHLDAPELESDEGSSDSDEDESPPPSPELMRSVVCGSTDTISLMYEAAQAAACLNSSGSESFTDTWDLPSRGAKVSSHRLPLSMNNNMAEVVC